MKRLCKLLALLALLAVLLALPVLAEETDLVFVPDITVTEQADTITVTIGTDGDNQTILRDRTPTLRIPCDFAKVTVTDPWGTALEAQVEGGEVRFIVAEPGIYTITKVEEKREDQHSGSAVLPTPKKDEKQADEAADEAEQPEPETGAEQAAPAPVTDTEAPELIESEPQQEPARAEALPFADVTGDDWFYAAVAYVYEEGLMNGVSDTAFSPDTTTTRAMVATILWRRAGAPAALGNGGFDDVPLDQWYTQAVAWAAKTGLMTGYDTNTFGPNDPITREQLVTILYRLAVAGGVDVSVGEDTNILSYNDAFDISEYAVPAFQWGCGAGLVEGSDGNLLPLDTATRAQLAALLMRLAALM